MAALRFEWDERKNTQNRHKHGVSFQEAQTVFFDERALLIADPDHPEDEERFVLVGLSSANPGGMSLLSAAGECYSTHFGSPG